MRAASAHFRMIAAASRRNFISKSRVAMHRPAAQLSQPSAKCQAFFRQYGVCALDGEGDEESLYLLPSSRRTKKARSRYELGEVIGAGKFAEVREAVDSHTGEKVAVKIMNKQRCSSSLLENELKMMESVEDVSHQRMTPFKGAWEDDANIYFVMELLRGGEMFDLVAEQGALSEKEVANFIRKLVFAIAALHREGILHRDIKLENIILTDRDSPDAFKIADFGFAHKMGEECSFATPAGTLGYAAPEVLSDREYGPPCDIWSAGIVLFILLAGYPPFPLAAQHSGRTLSANSMLSAELEAIKFGRQSGVWKSALKEPPWDKVSKEAKDLCTKMLRLDPRKRLTAENVLKHRFLQTNRSSQTYEYHNFM